ncbi:MAG: chemotaxis response regulator protein-glutamate methylesterase [Gammaproteobacteria bacterium]
MKKIKVLVVDDSALIRRLFTDMLNADPHIEVIDTANDPIEARSKIKQHNPDVITLDIEMPKMDGITFLEKLMRLHPLPVIMISSHTKKGAECVMRSLQIGAVDFMPKPVNHEDNSLNIYASNLINKIKIASKANVTKHLEINSNNYENNTSDDLLHVSNRSNPELLNCNTNIQLVAIGSSTGGTEAVAEVLKSIPSDFPPIVITQHIPSKFSKAFAERLNRNCAGIIVEAQDGDEIKPGHVYIAPGGFQMEVVKYKYNLICKVYEGEKVNRHCPSVEVLFKSVAKVVGKKVISVMLTGMGDDGSASMKDIQDVGGTTIAQDEKSSVVWGMPGAAVKLGCIDKIVSLSNIAPELVNICREDSRKPISSLKAAI